MKNGRFVLVLVAMFMLAPGFALAEEPCTMKVVPTTADLVKYPERSGPLTMAEVAALGLRPMTLKEPWVGYNLYKRIRCDGRYIPERLPAGTLVLADEAGKPIYKASCGNRLAPLEECPKCVEPPKVAAPPIPLVEKPEPAKGWWAGLPGWAKLLLGLILAALGILVLLAISGFAVEILRWMGRGRRPAPEPEPVRPGVGPAPAPVVAPVAPIPGAPVPGPVPPAPAGSVTIVLTASGTVSVPPGTTVQVGPGR